MISRFNFDIPRLNLQNAKFKVTTKFSVRIARPHITLLFLLRKHPLNLLQHTDVRMYCRTY